MAVRPSLRISILNRDSYTCQYCGARAPHVKLHVDHIISVKNGGPDHPSNLVTSCKDCNLGKGRRSLKIEDLNAEFEIKPDPICFLDFESEASPKSALPSKQQPCVPVDCEAILRSVSRAHYHAWREASRLEWLEAMVLVSEDSSEFTDGDY